MNSYCHVVYVDAVFIFTHGGFGDIVLMADNVVVLLDDVGESRCTRISSLAFLLLHARSWVEALLP